VFLKRRKSNKIGEEEEKKTNFNRKKSIDIPFIKFLGKNERMNIIIHFCFVSSQPSGQKEQEQQKNK
jgi:hypothetical protein